MEKSIEKERVFRIRRLIKCGLAGQV